MVSNQSAQTIQITVTDDSMEFGGDSWSLPSVKSSEIGEATDSELLVLEAIASALLMMGGVGLGLVGESLLYMAVTSLPGIALVAMAVHRRRPRLLAARHQIGKRADQWPENCSASSRTHHGGTHMASTLSRQNSEIVVTGNAVESGGNSWSLAGVKFVDIREKQDFMLPLLEVVAASLLLMGGIGLGVVGESLIWGALTCLPGLALAAMAVHRVVSGFPTYSLVLKRANSEDVVAFSADRRQLESAADRVRSARS